MSKILKPFGRVIRRVVIEIDHNGQRQLTASNEETKSLIGGQSAPMMASEVALVLAQMQADVAAQLHMLSLRMNPKAGVKVDSNGEES